MPITQEIDNSPPKHLINNIKKNYFSFSKETFPLKINIPKECNYYPMQFNLKDNYNDYIENSLRSISRLHQINSMNEINKIKHILPEECLNYFSNRRSIYKQLVLIDLDETLIHSDFCDNFTQHDTFIEFQDEEQNVPVKVNINIRPDVKMFLHKLSLYFDLAIFTSSIEEYAKAVMNKLDKKKQMFKFLLHRNHCLDYNGRFYVKDLRIIEDFISLEKVIIIDNNVFSFCNQLENGVLIHSFFNDKDDDDLHKVFCYLMQFIYKVNNVQEINENMFRFKYISEQFK